MKRAKEQLEQGIASNNIDMIQAALSAGADLSTKTSTGDTMITLAVKHPTSDNTAALELILKACEDHKISLVDTENKHGWTPLTIAVHNNKSDAVGCLLKHNVDPCKPDRYDQRPLRHAKIHGRPGIEKLLEQHCINKCIDLANDIAETNAMPTKEQARKINRYLKDFDKENLKQAASQIATNTSLQATNEITEVIQNAADKLATFPKSLSFFNSITPSPLSKLATMLKQPQKPLSPSL